MQYQIGYLLDSVNLRINMDLIVSDCVDRLKSQPKADDYENKNIKYKNIAHGVN